MSDREPPTAMDDVPADVVPSQRVREALGPVYVLAYRNDETYGTLTPEERYTAFLAWISAELGDETPAGDAA